MKKTMFKKSISLMLTVLMIMSCWVFVAPEHAHAAMTSVKPTAWTAMYNGSGSRGDSTKLVICSDGEAGNTTVGELRFPISSFPTTFNKVTLTVNSGNHGGTLVSGCYVNIFSISPSKCQATSGTYVYNNISNIYGGNYNSSTGVTNAYSYYGVSADDSLGTIYQSQTGSHAIDVTDAVKAAKAAGQSELCLAFIMAACFNDGNGNSWSDTHINVSGTNLSCEYIPDTAQAGQYYIKYVVNVTSYSSYEKDYNLMVSYITNNGKGTLVEDKVLFDKDSMDNKNVDNLVLYEGYIDGFPTELWQHMAFSYDTNSERQENFRLYIGSGPDNLTDYSLLLTSGNNWTYKNSYQDNHMTVQSGFDPYQASIVGMSALSIAVGKDGKGQSEKTIGEVRDQYGVSWYQAPSYSVSSSGTSQVNVSGVSVVTSGAGAYVKVDNLANVTGYNPQTGTATVYLRATSGGATASVPVTITSPKFNMTFASPDDATAVATKQFNYAQPLGSTLTVPTRPGYTFKGWWIDLDGNGIQNGDEGLGEPLAWADGTVRSDLQSFAITQDWALISVWDANEYNAMFDNIFDFSKFILSTDATKEIYDRTDTGFTIKSLSGNDSNTGFSYLIPVESGKTYTLSADTSFNAAGGGGYDIYIHTLNSSQIDEHSAVAVAGTGNTGKESGDANSPYIRMSGQSASDPYITFTAGDTTAYVRIRFDANNEGNVLTVNNIRLCEENGVTVSPVNKVVTYNSAYGTLPTPTREGYTFAGWKDSDGNIVTESSIVDYIGNEILYSQWTINQYTVKFVNAAGTTVSETKYDYGTSASAIAKPANTASGFDTTQHYKYSWPTINDLGAADVEYKEIKTGTNHSFGESITKNATCTTPGEKKYTCDCGYSYTETIEATGHSYTSSITKTPTCTDEGVETFTCSKCSDTYTKAISAKGHTPGAAATCTAPQTCTVCGAELAAQLPHTEETIPAVAATCTSTGLTEGKKCSVCGTVTVTQTVTAQLPHTEATREENRNEATCGAAGSYDLVTYCSVCKEVLGTEEKTIPATGHHSWGDGEVTTQPTCITPGVRTYTCSVCNDTKTETISATGEHKYGDWAQYNDGTTHRRVCTADENCTAYEEGAHNFSGAVHKDENSNYHDYKCEKCDAYGVGAALNVKEECFGEGTSFTQIDSDGARHNEKCKCGREKTDAHTYGAWVADPENKADDKGTMSRVCSECQYKQTSSCNYEKTTNYKAPTCTENGYQGWKCKDADCENGYTEILMAKGHAFGETVTANGATCTVDGNKAYKQCTACNLYFAADAENTETDGKADNKDFIIEAKGHDYKAVVTDPTCEDKGYTTHICSRCNDSYVDNYVNALGHDYASEVTTPATCLTDGLRTYTCQNDSTHTYTEVIQSLGHIDENNNGYCDRCSVLICDHKDQVLVTKNDKEATCLEDGYTGDKHCAKCDEVVEKGTVIDKLGHKDENKDHKCDNKNCDVIQGKHEDADKNHVCDYGCSESIGTCEDENKDHKCDYGCTKTYGEHKDANKDHTCDYGCSVAIGDCKDEDKDHKCDYGCTKTYGEHEDANKDHACDYGCKVTIGTCEDKDKDHDCDYGCEIYFGTHKDTDKDHACDYGCKVTIGACEDEDKDHKCDYGCTKTYGEHEDANKDHTCDYGCSESIGTCEDKDKDHKCDYGCTKTYGEHEDANKDHACDYGCKVTIGTCEDKDKDHDCDYGCEIYFGTHKDTDKDHACDYGCKVTIGACEDEDKDHKCDYGCTKTYGEHEDANKDHTCDYGCSESIGTCEDKDKDHKCDYGCGKTYGEHKDANKDHACDYGCKVTIGACEDKDKDHKCDYGCTKTYGEHEDANKDHACDYGCKVTIGACKDEDKDHKCDYGCTKTYGTHGDANKDHTCDYGCSVVIGEHADSAEDKDHICDYCESDEVLENCTESDWITDVAATCEGKGSQYKKCTVCDKELKREDLNPINHNYDTTKTEENLTRPTKNADGTWAQGYYTYTCKNNSEHKDKEYVDRASYTAYEAALVNLNELLKTDITDEARGTIEKAIADNEVADNLIATEQPLINAATAKLVEAFNNNNNSGSLKTYTVTFVIDGKETKVTVISGQAATTPTEVKKAYDETYHYAFNGWDNEEFTNVTSDLIVTAQFKAIEHTYTHTDKDDTYHTDECACGYNKDVKHTETSVVTTKATCEADGLRTYTCSVCSGTRTEEIAKREHVYKDNGVDTNATCTTAGVMKTICTNTETETHKACTHESTRVIDIDPTAHKYAEATYLWEKTSDGWNCTATRVCANNSDHTETATAKITSEVKTSATCTVDGWTTYTATFEETWAKIQTKDVQDIPAINHDWNETTYSFADDGSACTATRVCKNDTKHVETVNAEISSAVKTSATCTVNGWTTYTATFEANWAKTQTKELQDIPAINHDWNETTYSFADDGKSCTATRVCANNSDHTETATAKITSAVKTSATCTVDGWTTYTATFEETWAKTQTKELQDIPAIDHDMQKTADEIAPTCEKTGKKAVFTCSYGCGHVTGGEEIKTLEHSYTGEYKWNDTTVPMSHSRKCVNGCGGYGEAENCTFNTITVEPTCMSEGYVLHTCTVCSGSYKTDVTTASGHDWSDWQHVEGTKKHTRTCKNNTEHTETVDCVMTNRYIAPTCTKEGISEDTCTECNYKYESKKISAHGHRYVDEEGKENAVIIEPGCTTAGSKYLVCLLCGAKTEPDEFGQATGHYLFVQEGYAATCTEDGRTVYKHCIKENCDYVEHAQIIKATGHQDDGHGNCQNCGGPLYDNGSKACSCLCHSDSGLMKFLYKIVLFFWKLFRIKGDCPCGAVHY